MDRRHPRALNINKYEYLSVQPRLALLKDWDMLVRRCEYLIENPPKKYKSYLLDQHFYIALANGNILGMEQALNEIISPKIARTRNSEFQWGLEERLINGWGIILSKIAFSQGYELNIESPWIPKDCLPNIPLTEYSLPLDVFDGFDLYEPFKDLEAWCGDVKDFSPRPPKEEPLRFKDMIKLLGLN